MFHVLKGLPTISIADSAKPILRVKLVCERPSYGWSRSPRYRIEVIGLTQPSAQSIPKPNHSHP